MTATYRLTDSEAAVVLVEGDEVERWCRHAALESPQDAGLTGNDRGVWPLLLPDVTGDRRQATG